MRAIQAAVRSAGPYYATRATIRALGYHMPEIHAAVRAGLIRWTSDGALEAVG